MNPSAEVPTIKHPTNNQQLHSLKPIIMPLNLKITSVPNQPKRFVGETHVLCDVTEYLDDFTWPCGQDLSQSSKNENTKRPNIEYVYIYINKYLNTVCIFCFTINPH